MRCQASAVACLTLSPPMCTRAVLMIHRVTWSLDFGRNITVLHLFPDHCLSTIVAVGMKYDPTCQQRYLSSTTALILPIICGCMVSVYEVTSPEKSDTKISNFGSVVCFLGYILGDNADAPNSPFSAVTRVEWMPLLLAIVVNSNPIKGEVQTILISWP